MPTNLALIDLISPYVLRSQDIGTWRPVLAVMFVEHFETFADDSGVVIEGVVRFSTDSLPFFDPKNAVLGNTPFGDPKPTGPVATEAVHPADDPDRRDPWIDFGDAHIDFRFVAPRRASQVVASGIGALGAPSAVFAPTATVLTALDPTPAPTDPAVPPHFSDYPSTAFTLDLLLTTAVLRPPMLHGATLAADGALVPDPAHDKVSLRLPRLKLRLTQGSNTGDPLSLDLVSAGATGLDDPADTGVLSAVTMDPPYAFIGTSNVVGFGFRSAVLDLSDGVTPSAVLEKFGFDESWQGLYLPEVRLFVAPHGMRDLAVDAGARDLLIGIGAHAGVSGDFDLEVIQQGGGDLHLSARFVTADGKSVPSVPIGPADAMAYIPAQTTMIIDVAGGRHPYNYTVAIGSDTLVDQPAIPLDLRDKPLGRGYAAVVKIVVTDSRPGSTPTKLDITAIRQDAPALPTPPPGGPVPPPTVATTSVQRDGKAIAEPVLRIVGQDDTSVTVSLDPPDPLTTWLVDGSEVTDQGQGGSHETRTVTIPLGLGETKTVVGRRRSFSGGQDIVCYFAHGRPYPGEGGLSTDDNGYSRDPRNTHTTPAVDGEPADGWTPGGYGVRDAYAPLLDHLNTQDPIEITGFTSQDEDNQSGPYLDTLAQRRARGFKALLDDAYAGKLVFTVADQPGPPVPQGGSRNSGWRAVATLPTTQDSAGTVGTQTTGSVSRPTAAAAPAEPQIDGKEPDSNSKPPAPSWFRSAGVKVRIVRDTFVACEVFGKIHYQTAAQEALAKGDAKGVLKNSTPPDLVPLGKNPGEGLIDFRVLVTIDDVAGSVSVLAQLGADAADKDGLFLTGSRPGEDPVPGNLGRDVLGLFALFTPLLAATAPPDPAGGDIAALVVSTLVTTLPFDLALLHLAKVERVIVYGGELAVRSRASGPEVSLLLDVEVAISASIKKGEGEKALVLLEIPPESPLVVRYKAIGVKLGYTPPEKRFQLRPVFDSSKGYTIDVSKPGAIKATEPLGKILQVLSSRLARTNPLTLDVDLGLKIDLGVVSVDRLGVRVPLDGKGLPQLSALGAGVDIPNVLKGKGYLEIHDTGFSGGLDITIIPVKLRVAAALRLEHIPASDGKNGQPGHPEATAIIAAIEVNFPMAIPLASSGLGIYGFLGLFAMHFARDESIITSTTTTPALAWLKETGGNPSDLTKWKPQLDSWAFGVGALLGSMEGGTLISMKGMLLLELPGPRVLLFVKANMLQPKPGLKGPAEGNLLAVIDIDTQRGTLTIGIVADYTVNPLIKLHIPVEAFFNFTNSKDWHLYVGEFDEPVQATILEVFDGSAYLMLSGNGLPEHKGLPPVDGFAVALGVHAVISWGVVSSGLYLKVTADVDVVVGFTPFRLAGKLKLAGELKLFIVSIGASAELDLDIAHKQVPATGNVPAHEETVYVISGEVCGELDLFFFKIKGCVHFELTGGSSPPGPVAPPLVSSLTLVSRSPALVVGTATDKGVDTGLGDAVEFEGTWVDPLPQPADQPPDGKVRMPVVPVDAMPVLIMSAPPITWDPKPFTDPHQPTDLQFRGDAPGGAPDQSGGGFVGRGDDWFRYDLKSVELVGEVSAGPTPATWWSLRPPIGGNQNAALALLSWIPTPAPKAVERSQVLTSTVEERWGNVCVPAAPPALVVYSFRQQAVGPSAAGWVLHGTAWPDPPGTQRSTPPTTTMAVRERWRCGNDIVDNGRGIVPATVLGAVIDCPVPDQPNDPSLAASGPPAPIISPVPQPPLIADLVTLASQGQPIGRQDVAGMVIAPITVNTAGDCQSRVLQAPIFDGTARPFNPTFDGAALAQIFTDLGYTPSPLWAAVELVTGGIASARILLLVREEVIRYGPHAVARVLDAAGNEIHRQPGRQITKNDFPADWTSPDGPGWLELNSLLLQGNTDERLSGLRMVLVELADLPAASRVEIGVEDPTVGEIVQAPFCLAMLDILTSAEVDRMAWDSTTLKNDQDVLSKALGEDSGNNALLQADTTYRVTATWTAVAAKRRKGADNQTDPLQAFDRISPAYDELPGDQLPTVTQTFWFRTDSKAPAHLDQWVLATSPVDNEQHVFGLEPIRMAFATTDVLRVYQQYGKRLQVRLRAASFRTPDQSPDLPPHPFPIDAGNPWAALTESSGAVLSPWEETVSTVLGNDSCVAVDGHRSRHLTMEVPIPLDPFTEYVMDVEAVDNVAAAGSPGEVVLRRTFTTSGYGTVQDYAAALLASRVQHRSIPAGAFATTYSKFSFLDPVGSQFDDELRAIGVEPLPVPDSTGAMVFWQQPAGSSQAQPVAVLVDGTEALWRSRPMPGREAHPDPQGVDQWTLTDQPWLALEIGAGNTAPVIHRIIRAPGQQRALILLEANARGTRLRLSLHRSRFSLDLLNAPGAVDVFAPAVDVTFSKAPWEEQQ